MLNLLDQIDQNLASFRLAMITGDKGLVDSATANIKGLLSQVSSHADAKNMLMPQPCLIKNSPRLLMNS